MALVTAVTAMALVQPRLPMAVSRHAPAYMAMVEANDNAESKSSFSWAAPKLALLAMAGTCGGRLHTCSPNTKRLKREPAIVGLCMDSLARTHSHCPSCPVPSVPNELPFVLGELPVPAASSNDVT